MKTEQNQPKQTENDNLLDLQQEDPTKQQDSPRETTPRIIRINNEEEKRTLNVTKQN